jgi:hypothetical protein
MRRISSAPFFSLCVAILSIFLAAPPASAQESRAVARAGAAPRDSAAALDGRGGKLRISIDQSGISIEGQARIDADGDSVGQWVEIRDDRGPYREKGVDIVKFGKSVFVAKDEMVRGDLVVFGGNAIIEGRVTGNVFVIGGNIRLRSGAEVNGDAMIIGGVLDEDDDVIIQGERILFDDIMPEIGIGGLFGHNTWLRWVIVPMFLFIKLVLAFLVVLFLRERVENGHDHLSSNFLKSFGIGVLTAVVGTFALLIVMIPLVITVIGIPLALLLMVSCAGVFMIAWTIFVFSLGRMAGSRLGAGTGNAFLCVFIGALVLFLPEFLSFIFGSLNAPLLKPLGLGVRLLGIMLGVFAYMTGLGALVISRFGSRTFAVHPAAPGATVGPSPGSQPARLS